MNIPYNKLKAIAAILNTIVLTYFVIGLAVQVIPDTFQVIMILANAAALGYNITTIEESK